jgi:hypothetical protein
MIYCPIHIAVLGRLGVNCGVDDFVRIARPAKVVGPSIARYPRVEYGNSLRVCSDPIVAGIKLIKAGASVRTCVSWGNGLTGGPLVVIKGGNEVCPWGKVPLPVDTNAWNA